MYNYKMMEKPLLEAGGKKLGIFLWRHGTPWKQHESYVNQAVAKSDVNQNLFLVDISHSYRFLYV